MSKVKELRDELVKDLCTTYAHPFFKEEAESMIDALIQAVREEECPVCKDRQEYFESYKYCMCHTCDGFGRIPKKDKK